MNEQELKDLLKTSLTSERRALEELKMRETEITVLKNKLSLYERRFERIRNFLPVKLLLKAKNVVKGLK